LKRFLIAALLLASCATTAPPNPTPPPLFVMHSNFWMNLHHFARVVARGMPAEATLTPEEQKTWDEGLAFYRANYINRDLAFDAGMVEIKEALRHAGNAPTLDGVNIDAELKSVLTRLAPVYRAHWWPQHDATHRAWIAAAMPLVERYGREIAPRIAAAYGTTWPSAPIDVDLTISAGAVGAYTTSTPVVHTTIASPDPGYGGMSALEMLFHETSHQFGVPLQRSLAYAAERHHREIPNQLWHAVLFHNAGEITRRVLAAHGVEYVDVATRSGHIYPDLCGPNCAERVAAAWDPHLDGKTTMDEATDTLVAGW